MLAGVEYKSTESEEACVHMYDRKVLILDIIILRTWVVVFFLYPGLSSHLISSL